MATAPTAPAPAGGFRIPSLDGLRAVSIAGVLWSHASPTAGISGGLRYALADRAGALGVLVFFVISGYLITTLLKREWARTGGIDLPAFYRRRILRIFPAFYTYLAVVAALTAAGVLHITRGELACAALHVWNYGGLWQSGTEHGGWFLGHFWTLSLEEQFYLLWPLTLAVLGLRRGTAFALAVCLLGPVMRVGCYLLFPSARGLTGMMLPTGGDAIMIGCLAALVEERPWFRQRVEPLLTPLGAVAALGVLAFVSTPLTFRYHGAYSLPVGRSLDAACVTVIVLAMTRSPGSLVGRCLNSRPLVHVGVLSYSLYLWQQLFLARLNTTWSGRFPINLACAFAAAVASYWLIERPFLRLKQRSHRGPKALAGEPEQQLKVASGEAVVPVP